tara:strand:- start:17886 stop:18359 length:474 start_codon:yes stop_codon:yes gene_type:complete
MKNIQLRNKLFILSSVIFAACTNEIAFGPKPQRMIFDQGDLRVITTSINPKSKSMSVLYGNDRAYTAALSGSGHHVAGERYTYLTWNYIENPRWFGSNISKDLLSEESIAVEGDGEEGSLKFHYKVENGDPLPVNGIRMNPQDRIAYIFEYRPSVLP